LRLNAFRSCLAPIRLNAKLPCLGEHFRAILLSVLALIVVCQVLLFRSRSLLFSAMFTVSRPTAGNGCRREPPVLGTDLHSRPCSIRKKPLQGADLCERHKLRGTEINVPFNKSRLDGWFCRLDFRFAAFSARLIKLLTDIGCAFHLQAQFSVGAIGPTPPRAIVTLSRQFPVC
jgi:hypothetical protein